jgi:hypothetical protein
MSAVRHLDDDLLKQILASAVSVDLQWQLRVLTHDGTDVQVHARTVADSAKCVNRAFRAAMNALKPHATIMPSLQLHRDAFFERAVSGAMHHIQHDHARPISRSYWMCSTMHMSGQQLALQLSVWGCIFGSCLKVRLGFYGGAELRMSDDDKPVADRHAYLYLDIPGNGFIQPVATRSAAQVAELAAWASSRACTLVAEMQELVTSRRRKVLGLSCPRLLSEKGLAGVNIWLRVTYMAAGATNTETRRTLTKAYDIFESFEICARDLLKDKGINLDEYQFFNQAGDEETLTFACGKPVLLDHLLRPLDRNLIDIIKLRMRRRA